MLDKISLIEKLIEVDHLSEDISYANHVIVMSDILKDALSRYHINEQKITVLGNRVDTSIFKPMYINKKNNNSIELLFVGRQQEQKNLHGIISAMRILISDGYEVKLYICGGGEKTDYTKSLITKDVADNCNFLGAVNNSELPYLYNSVDMLVNPSFFEGFQIPLIEALSCGTPVVTSNQEPSNKIISMETGALVNPADPNDIAKGILSVKSKLNDESKKTELKAKCRIEAITKWDYYIISKKEVDVYKMVMGIRN